MKGVPPGDGTNSITPFKNKHNTYEKSTIHRDVLCLFPAT